MTYTTSWQVRETLRCDAADQDGEGGEVCLHADEFMFDLCGSRLTGRSTRQLALTSMRQSRCDGYRLGT